MKSITKTNKISKKTKLAKKSLSKKTENKSKKIILNKEKTPKLRNIQKSEEKILVHEEDAQLPEEKTKIPEIKETALKHEINYLKEMKEKIIERLSLEQLHHEIEEEKEELKEIIEEKLPTNKPEQKEKNINDNKARVEAILFAIGKYVDDELISQLCELDKKQTKKALEELKKDYDSRDSALAVFQEGNNWKINVREKYLTIVRKIVADTELSKSIMETLAVIAWKSPVYQNEVVRIRGNKCYDHIAELETAGFVTKDKKGRSYILKTTDKFYNYFDIDQKNLKGVMGEAKMPAQTTLEEVNVPEEIIDSKEKLLRALETIETKSIVRTEDEKSSQREFLDKMHQKIEEAAKRTDEYSSDIPKPMHEQEPVIEETPPPLEGDAVVEKDEEDIVIETGETNAEHHFQKPEEQPQKPKQLTKKQLEKKFKDELQRVKEKSEKR